MNAVIYCRVSTKEQVQNLSLGTQQTRCVDFCTRNNWAALKVFRDEGESAKTADQFVVVHDLSRFSRDMGDQACVIAELESAGVHLRSVMENVDETAAGK